MAGERHGHLVAVSDAGSSANRGRLWLCRCDCGEEVVVLGCNLRYGKSRSCGCRNGINRMGVRYGMLVVVGRPKKERRARVWLCRCDCGTEKWVRGDDLRSDDDMRDGGVKSCGCLHKRVGAEHPGWRGGRKVARGYVQVWVSPSSPYASMARSGGAQRQRYVFEHRLVMAEHLGRPLTRNEHVHHLNGAKDDNRIENLALTTPNEHAALDALRRKDELERLRARVVALETQLAQAVAA
jgi:hypothetical protein